MDIRNVTQFASFISDNDLGRIDGIFQQVITCINTYKFSCNCYKLEDKQKLYASCNKMYMDSVQHIVPRFKNEFLSKIPERQISFYMENGGLIFILSR